MNDPIKTLESELARVTEDLEAVRRERDEWKARFEGEAEVCSLYRDELATYKSSKPEWDRILNQTVHERDAKRERSDVMAASLEKIFYDAVIIRPGKNESEALQDVYDEAGTALSAGSDTLARRDARMKAKALERLLAETVNCNGEPVVLRVDIDRHRDEYRRQAEGDNQ